MNLQERKQLLKAQGFDPSEYDDAEIMSLNPDKLKAAPNPEMGIVQVDTPEPEMYLEERAPVKGRFAVKNLSGEDSDEAIQYLANENPGFQFTRKDNRIFARPKGETNWKALDPDTFELADISDVAFDVGTGLASTAGMIAAGLPTGGVGGAVGGAATGYGMEKLRDYLGEMVGVRGEQDESGAIPAAAVGALVPGMGAAVRGTGKAIASMPGVESLTGIPGDIYKRLVADRGFNEFSKGLATDYGKMQSAISSFTEPVIQRFSDTKRAAGNALSSTIGQIDQATKQMGFQGVSTNDLYKAVSKKFSELKPSIKTPEGKEQVQAVSDFIERNFYDSKGNKFDFMSLRQLQDLKEQIRAASNFDVSTSQVKPGVAKRLDSLAKNVESKITEIQDAWADNVMPQAKGMLKNQRKEYSKLLDEEALLKPLESPSFYTQASTLPKSSRTQLRSLIDKYTKGLPNESEIKRNMDAVALSRIGQEGTSIPSSTVQGFIRGTIANPSLVSGASSIGSELTMPTTLRGLAGPTGRRFGLLTGSTMLREKDE